jgi:hypothetical protein
MPGTETVGQTVGEQLGTLVHMLGTETVGQTVREQLGTLVHMLGTETVGQTVRTVGNAGEGYVERLMFLNPPWYKGGLFTCQVRTETVGQMVREQLGTQVKDIEVDVPKPHCC